MVEDVEDVEEVCGCGGGWRRVVCGVKVSERVVCMSIMSEEMREEEAEQCWADMLSSSCCGLDQAEDTG